METQAHLFTNSPKQHRKNSSHTSNQKMTPGKFDFDVEFEDQNNQLLAQQFKKMNTLNQKDAALNHELSDGRDLMDEDELLMENSEVHIPDIRLSDYGTEYNEFQMYETEMMRKRSTIKLSDRYLTRHASKRGESEFNDGESVNSASRGAMMDKILEVYNIYLKV